MDFGLKGKVAMVLAASTGLGRGIAEVLAQEGCDLAICSRSLDKLNDTARHIRTTTGREVLYSVADVANSNSIHSFFRESIEKYRRIDILVTNAGGPPLGSSKELNDEHYQFAFELTLMSVVRSCRLVVPGMRERRWGRIIILSSTNVKCAADNLLLSNVFRSAVAGFSKSLAMETARDGIRVHCVMAGPFMTDRAIQIGTSAANKTSITFEDWRREAEANTLLGRFGEPREMGNFVAFLASEGSSYMTGTCIAIDGGVLKTIS